MRAELHINICFIQIIQKYYNRTEEYDDYENYTKNLTIKEINVPHLIGDWLSFLKEITGLNVTGEDNVIFTTDTYLEDLRDLFERTPKK